VNFSGCQNHLRERVAVVYESRPLTQAVLTSRRFWQAGGSDKGRL